MEIDYIMYLQRFGMNLVILVGHIFWLMLDLRIVLYFWVLPSPPLPIQLLFLIFIFRVGFRGGYIFSNIEEFLSPMVNKFLFLFSPPECCSQRGADQGGRAQLVSPPDIGSAQRSTCITWTPEWIPGFEPLKRACKQLLIKYLSSWNTLKPLLPSSFCRQLRALQGSWAGAGAAGRSTATSLSGWDKHWVWQIGFFGGSLLRVEL